MKALLRYLRFGVLAAAVGVPTVGHAQSDVPVWFISGFYETIANWGTTPHNLATNLHVTADTGAGNTTTAHYQSQASTVLGQSPSTSSIFVGHSNGGIVSRVVGGQQTLAGILTFASPNQGAPLVDGAPGFADYGLYTASALLSMTADFGYYAISGPEDDSYWLGVVELAVGTIPSDLETTTANWLGSLFGYGAPVVSQMSPSSGFMLDTLPYLGESAHVATRVGLTYTTDNFYTGGLFKLHNPTDPTTADAETSAYYAVVDAVYYWGDYIAALPDDGDPDIYAQHFDESDHVYSLADWLSILDDEYCGGVNGGYCYASDEVVPTWSQGYPSATEVDAGGPLVHTSEPSGDYADLSYVLVHNFGVSSR